jgi:hypothetical protein
MSFVMESRLTPGERWRGQPSGPAAGPSAYGETRPTGDTTSFSTRSLAEAHAIKLKRDGEAQAKRRGSTLHEFSP